MGNEEKIIPLPHNIEVEQSLLGSILVSNNAYYKVNNFLEPEHFYEPLHQEIYKISGEMILARKTASPITIKTFIPSDTVIGDMSVQEYLARLASEATNVNNCESYGTAIFDLFVRRELRFVSEDILNISSFSEVTVKPFDMVEDAIGKLLDINTNVGDQKINSSASEISRQVMFETEEAYKNKEIRGVKLPLREMTEINQGLLEAGNLYGLLGGTKEGKSSLTAMQIRSALDGGNPVLVLSYDQTGVQWFRQMAAQVLGIDANKQRKGEVSPDEHALLYDYFNKLSSSFIEVIKCRQENCDQLISHATRFIRKCQRIKEVPLIILDHVGKIPPKDPRADAGKQAGHSNQAFKSFCGEHDCVWLSLIQRNSSGASRQNPRPVKKDVHGGEAAIADYDGIFYIYREEKWRNDQRKIAEPRDYDRLDAIIADKQGKAEIGLIAHRFAPDHIRKSVKFIPELTLYKSEYPVQEDFGL